MPVAFAAPPLFATCPACLGGGGGGGGVTTFSALTDTAIAGLAVGQVPVWNGTTWVNQTINLNDLGDVTAVGPADGQTIVWDSAANAGAGGYVLGSAGAANARVHLTNTAVAPATAGSPTVAEITAAAGANRDTILYYTGDDLPASTPSHAYHIDVNGDVTLLEDPDVGAANASVFLSEAAVAPATAGSPTLAEITAAAGAARDTILRYTGTNAAGDPVTHVYQIDTAGLVTTLQEPSGTANATVFLSNTAVAPAAAGAPTLAEITAAAGANRDRFLVYTGTDVPGDPVTYAYFVDSAGTVTLVEQPAPAAAANPNIHLTDTAVAPATAGEPTLAEITAAAGANRDVFLTYTGTDTATDPVVRTYHIDQAGAVILVEEPNVATCGLRELGGVGGQLAVGVGAGVANPVLDGYTLSSGRLTAIVTTPPVGGSDSFEVRLEPAGTVVSTGTVAAGATAATFTPFADLAVATGQWFEIVVTAVSAGTPSSELTVVGELCGPGTPTTTAAGGPDVDSYLHTEAVAAASWTVVHNLNRNVSVRVEAADGTDITPDNVITIDSNTVQVDFLVAQAGTAIIT